MKKILIIIVIFILAVCRGGGLKGEDITGFELNREEYKYSHEKFDQFKNRLREHMKEVDTISFDFLQKSYIAASTRTVKAKIKFKRPEKLFMKYTRPSPQNIIFSEGTLYTYVPSINQATRQKSKSISGILGTSASLIISDTPFEDLSQNFSLTGYKINSDLFLLRAEPLQKQKHNFEHMDIFVNTARYLPRKTVVTGENFKSVTEFSEYKINLQLEDSIFSLKEEEGINIINIK